MANDDEQLPLIVGRPDHLAEMFYRNYNPDHWFYKISLLKECHDQYDSLKPSLTRQLDEFVDEDYKKMLRTEMHFVYFQMIEALFELIFAVLSDDSRYAWLAMSFSHDRRTRYYMNTSARIRELKKSGLPEFHPEVVAAFSVDGKRIEKPLIQWIFYFVYDSIRSEQDRKKNLETIWSFLKIFASDFCNREDYNAYKHGLRFFSGPVHMTLRNEQSGSAASLGADDSITYLTKGRKGTSVSGEPGIHVCISTKAFDVERDFKCCLILHKLIWNIVITRKHSFLKEKTGEPFNFINFDEIAIQELWSRTGFKSYTYTT